MHEEEKAKFPEILPVIEEYLKKQQANGEPMRIHFWDTNHFTDEPHQVFADKSLHDLVKKYGAPLYVMEYGDITYDTAYIEKNIPSSITDKERLANFNKEFVTYDKNNVSHPNPRTASLGQLTIYKLDDESANYKTPTKIILPDSREELYVKLYRDEEKLIKKTIKFEMETAQKITKKKLSTEQKESFRQEEYNKQFSKYEQSRIEKFRENSESILFGGYIGDTSITDKKTADNINTVFNPERDVQVTLYGAAHFTKENVLNERMEGLSIAITNSSSKDFKAIRNVYLLLPYREIHNQFPDYVYYANEKRLVKMDNEAAKADFLGLTEEQFNAYKVARHMDKEKRFIAPLEMYDTKTIEAPPPIEFRKPSPQNRHNQPSDRGV